MQPDSGLITIRKRKKPKDCRAYIFNPLGALSTFFQTKLVADLQVRKNEFTNGLTLMGTDARGTSFTIRFYREGVADNIRHNNKIAIKKLEPYLGRKEVPNIWIKGKFDYTPNLWRYTSSSLAAARVNFDDKPVCQPKKH
jgi:hypothetical protein